MPMDPQRRACRVVWKGVVLALLATPLPLQAQEDTSGSGLYVAVSALRVSLYRGDATVGPVSNLGWAGTVAARSPSNLGGELFVTFLPVGRDPYDRAPQLVTVGGWATLSLSPHPRRGLDVFGGAGLAYLGVRGWPDFSGCTPEVGCFLEGGPSFENGDSVVPVVGAGMTYSHRPVAVRADLRWIPSSDHAGQSTIQTGLGVALVLR
jgi:hypothetical protein